MASSYTMVYVPVGNRHKGFSKPTISVGYCTPKRCLVAIAVSMTTSYHHSKHVIKFLPALVNNLFYFSSLVDL
ncbi:hypothetical protein EB796_007696 [Bugula neritina]|uniref:Uncharacterized protein n=1 Tax=Bugula neritina TaxID=10212 RepID=A0A7J7K820_BUGNE|nr:hypothetical protein EB796_007696 [Bugula neritina]